MMTVFSNRAPRSRETSNAYVQAVTELVGSREPFEILRSTPQTLSDMLATTPRASRVRPEAPGKWSLSAVIHHLADTELVWGYRLRRVLTEDRPTLEGFDQDVWADRLGYEDADVEESLLLFTTLRRANLRLAQRTGPEDLARTVSHVERGETTLAALFVHQAGHDVLHLRQMERIRNVVLG